MAMQNHENKIHILFICHGNICRSPMAEMILKELVRQKGLEGKYDISSMAATTEEVGHDIYPPCQKDPPGPPYSLYEEKGGSHDQERL